LYYGQVQAVGQVKATEAALAYHAAMVEGAVDDFPEQEKDIRKDADLEDAILTGYFEWLEETGADAGLRVVAAEQSVELPVRVGDQVVELSAKLDLRARRVHDGADMFLDHKTVQEFTTPTKSLTLDEQLKLYAWLLQQVTGEKVGGALYNMLRKSKRTARATPPFYERLSVTYSEQEIESFGTRLLGELEVMLNTRKRLDAGGNPLAVVYPSPNRNCHWDCPFFAVCGLIDRPNDKPDQLIATLYEESDPYARYAESGKGELT
jgi:hypothetical protein